MTQPFDLTLEVKVPPPNTPTLNGTDQPRYFWCISTGPGVPNRVSWSQYIAVNQLELRPKWLITAQGILFVGAEQSLFILDAASGDLLGTIPGLTFVQSIETTSKGLILAACETDLLLLGPDGTLRWRSSIPDVIQDIVETASTFTVESIEGNKYELDGLTGRPLRTY